jgi:hypothetical protein
MSFRLRWTSDATKTFEELHRVAEKAAEARTRAAKKPGAKKRAKSSKREGLFKQVAEAVQQLANDPHHQSLNTHAYSSLDHPFDPKGKVFEAYAQNRTPGAYRVFWCYGPDKGEITIIAITPHP